MPGHSFHYNRTIGLHTITKISSYALTILSSTSLLIAAVLKWKHLVAPWQQFLGLHLSPTIMVGIIVVEMALALWLLLGSWPYWSVRVAAITFAVFAVVSFSEALSGAESCGCFGQVKMNPWLTFTMDLMLAAGLWITRPRKGRPGPILLPRLSPCLRTALILVGAALALDMSLWRLPRTVIAAEDGQPAEWVQAGSLTILEPQRWIGKTFPLLSRIDVGGQLRSGRWVVVLHRADCSTCQEALPFYQAQARDAADHRVALVEMPPYESPDLSSPGTVRGKLSADREWFASTPLVVLLDEGIVRDAAEGKPAVALKADMNTLKLIPLQTH